MACQTHSLAAQIDTCDVQKSKHGRERASDVDRISSSSQLARTLDAARLSSSRFVVYRIHTNDSRGATVPSATFNDHSIELIIGRVNDHRRHRNAFDDISLALSLSSDEFNVQNVLLTQMFTSFDTTLAIRRQTDDPIVLMS